MAFRGRHREKERHELRDTDSETDKRSREMETDRGVKSERRQKEKTEARKYRDDNVLIMTASREQLGGGTKQERTQGTEKERSQ